MFRRILLGLLISGLSGLGVYYAPRLVQVFGRSIRAEQHLGWTKNAILIWSFLLMVVWFLVMFGVIGYASPLDMAAPQL